MITKKQHWNNVGNLKCVMSGRPNPTLHHCHGGSMVVRGVQRGGSQKTSDFLVIPLDAEYHTGNNGIDTAMSVNAWEDLFGDQADMLDEVSELLGYDVWELAEKEKIITIGEISPHTEPYASGRIKHQGDLDAEGK